MNVITVIAIVVILVQYIIILSLTFRSSYYKQKLINRNVDISSVNSFWSFLQ